MLKGIDPILNADVLHALKSMGHGDELVITDTNFPADSVARQSVLGRLLRLENVTAARAVKSILSLMPLDSFVEFPVRRMEIVGKPGEVPKVQEEVQAEVDAADRGGGYTILKLRRASPQSCADSLSRTNGPVPPRRGMEPGPPVERYKTRIACSPPP